MADVIEKDLTKVTSSDLTPITKPSSGTDKRYMRMVDKDGNSVDVEVSAFLRAAIRDELASILESGGTGGGSVLSVIGGVLKTRTDADLASVLGEKWPTIDGNASPGNPFNAGRILGLLRVTIVNTTTYGEPSYIIVSGEKITELYKGWYISSWTLNSSKELLVDTVSTQHVYVTKIM